MKKFKLNSDWAFPIIFGIISLLSIGWFKGDNFILAGDLGWPLDFKRFLESTLSVWDRSVAPGYLTSRQPASIFPFAFYGYLFNLLGFSSSVFQKVTYMVSFFFSGFGFYLLMKRLNVSNAVALVTGLFYMLSPYALVVVWNPSYGQTFPFYTFFPLVLSLHLRYMKSCTVFSKELFSGLIISSLSLIGTSFSNPTFFILLFCGFGIITVIVLLESETLSSKDVLTKAFVYLLSYIFLNMFWLFPLIADLNNAFSSADNSTIGVMKDNATQYLNSVSYYNAFRLSGLWTAQAEYLGDYYYAFHTFWDSFFYIISSYVFVFFLIFAYMRSKNKKYAFIFLVFLFAFLLNAGLRGSGLFKDFTEILYRLTYFGRAFRSVYLKFGALLVLSFSMLFGFLLNIYSNKVLNIGLTLVILVHAFPFFTGDIIKGPGINMPSYSVTIPEDYYDVSNFINSDNEEIKVLMLPVPVGYNVHLSWGSGGYIGAEFMRTLLDKPLYYQGSFRMIQFLTENMNVDYLGSVNIKYIILRKDIFSGDLRRDYLTKSWDEIFTLVDSSEITKLMETDNLVLYEISKEKVKPLFYSSNFGDKISFEKMNPAKFRVTLHTTDFNTTLFFNEGFNNNWKANILPTSNGTISREYSSEFINSWYLSGSNDYEILIYNSAQNYLYVGISISVVTLGILLVFLFKGSRDFD